MILFNHLLKKWTAIFVIATQLAVLAPESSHASVVETKPAQAQAAQKLISFESWSLPQQWGHVDFYQKSSSPKTLLLIEDAHAVSDAQKSIFEILKLIQNRDQVKSILLEGLGTVPDLSVFQSFPDREWLNQSLEALLMSNDLSGAPASAILSNPTSRFIPTEQKKIYVKTIRQYLKALHDQPAILKALQREKQKISQQKKEHYSARALEIDHLIDLSIDVFENEKSWKKVTPLLKNISAQDYPHLKRLGRVLSAEALIQRPLVRQAFARTVSELKKNLYVMGEIEQQLNNEKNSLLELAEKVIQLKSIPAEIQNQKDFKLIRYLARIRAEAASVKGEPLAEELEKRLTQELEKQLFSPESRILNRKSKLLRFYQRLAEMKISRKDYRFYSKQVGELRSKQRWQHILAFYSLQSQREDHFIQNVSTAFQKENVAALVAGGFHREGILNAAKKKGWSVVVIQPAMKNFPDENLYSKLMQGEVSWKNHFQIKQNQIDLENAFLNELLSKLHQEKPQETYEILRDWRKQYILKLSDQKKTLHFERFSEFFYQGLAQAIPESEKNALRQGWAQHLRSFSAGIKNLRAENRLNPESLNGLIHSASHAQIPVHMPFDFIPSDLIQSPRRTELGVNLTEKAIKAIPSERSGGKEVKVRSRIYFSSKLFIVAGLMGLFFFSSLHGENVQTVISTNSSSAVLVSNPPEYAIRRQEIAQKFQKLYEEAKKDPSLAVSLVVIFMAIPWTGYLFFKSFKKDNRSEARAFSKKTVWQLSWMAIFTAAAYSAVIGGVDFLLKYSILIAEGGMLTGLLAWLSTMKSGFRSQMSWAVLAMTFSYVIFHFTIPAFFPFFQFNQISNYSNLVVDMAIGIFSSGLGKGMGMFVGEKVFGNQPTSLREKWQAMRRWGFAFGLIQGFYIYGTFVGFQNQITSLVHDPYLGNIFFKALFDQGIATPVVHMLYGTALGAAFGDQKNIAADFSKLGRGRLGEFLKTETGIFYLTYLPINFLIWVPLLVGLWTYFPNGGWGFKVSMAAAIMLYTSFFSQMIEKSFTTRSVRSEIRSSEAIESLPPHEKLKYYRDVAELDARTFGQLLNPEKPIDNSVLLKMEKKKAPIRSELLPRARQLAIQYGSQKLMRIRSLVRWKVGELEFPQKIGRSYADVHAWENQTALVPASVLAEAMNYYRKVTAELLQETKEMCDLTLKELGEKLNPEEPISITETARFLSEEKPFSFERMDFFMQESPKWIGRRLIDIRERAGDSREEFGRLLSPRRTAETLVGYEMGVMRASKDTIESALKILAKKIQDYYEMSEAYEADFLRELNPVDPVRKDQFLDMVNRKRPMIEVGKSYQLIPQDWMDRIRRLAMERGKVRFKQFREDLAQLSPEEMKQALIEDPQDVDAIHIVDWESGKMEIPMRFYRRAKKIAYEKSRSQIQTIMIRLGVSQQWLADQVGVARTSLEFYLTAGEPLRFETFQTWAEVLPRIRVVMHQEETKRLNAAEKISRLSQNEFKKSLQLSADELLHYEEWLGWTSQQAMSSAVPQQFLARAAAVSQLHARAAFRELVVLSGDSRTSLADSLQLAGVTFDEMMSGDKPLTEEILNKMEEKVRGKWKLWLFAVRERLGLSGAVALSEVVHETDPELSPPPEQVQRWLDGVETIPLRVTDDLTRYLGQRGIRVGLRSEMRREDKTLTEKIAFAYHQDRIAAAISVLSGGSDDHHGSGAALLRNLENDHSWLWEGNKPVTRAILEDALLLANSPPHLRSNIKLHERDLLLTELEKILIQDRARLSWAAAHFFLEDQTLQLNGDMTPGTVQPKIKLALSLKSRGLMPSLEGVIIDLFDASSGALAGSQEISHGAVTFENLSIENSYQFAVRRSEIRSQSHQQNRSELREGKEELIAHFVKNWHEIKKSGSFMFDVSGTVRWDNHISDEMAEALAWLLQEGIHIGFVSGVPIDTLHKEILEPIFAKLSEPVNYYPQITIYAGAGALKMKLNSNGEYVEDEKYSKRFIIPAAIESKVNNAIQNFFLRPDVKSFLKKHEKELLELARKRKSGKFFLNDWISPILDGDIYWDRHHSGFTSPVPALLGTYDPLHRLLHWLLIFTPIYEGRDLKKEMIQFVIEEIGKRASQYIHFQEANVTSLHITHKKVSKATAIRDYLEYSGRARPWTFYFDDDYAKTAEHTGAAESITEIENFDQNTISVGKGERLGESKVRYHIGNAPSEPAKIAGKAAHGPDELVKLISDLRKTVSARSEIRKPQLSSDWKNKKIAITGAAGQIGSVLADEAMKEGAFASLLMLAHEHGEYARYRVQGEKGPSAGLREGTDQYRMTVGRLPNESLQRELVQGSDIVFHLADLPLNGANGKTSLAELLATDPLATAGFIHASEKLEKPLRIVYASSIEVYGLMPFEKRSQPNYLLKESDVSDSNLDPTLNYWINRMADFLTQASEGNYGRQTSWRETVQTIEEFLQRYPPPEEYLTMPRALSKIISERLLTRYNFQPRKATARSHEAVILRLSGVYGPGYDAPYREFKGNPIHQYFHLAGEDEDIPYFEGKKQFVYVGDVAKAFMRAATLPLQAFGDEPAVLNVGSDELLSGEEIAEAVLKVSGRKGHAIQGEASQSHMLMDLSKTQKILGLSLTPLKKGLAETWQWLTKSHEEKNTWSNRFFSSVRRLPKPTVKKIVEFRKELPKLRFRANEIEQKIKKLYEDRQWNKSHVPPIVILAWLLAAAINWVIGPYFRWSSPGYLAMAVFLLGTGYAIQALRPFSLSEQDLKEKKEALERERRQLQKLIYTWIENRDSEKAPFEVSDGDTPELRRIEKALAKIKEQNQVDFEEPTASITEFKELIREFERKMNVYQLNPPIHPSEAETALNEELNDRVERVFSSAEVLVFDSAQFLAGGAVNRELLDEIYNLDLRNVKTAMQNFLNHLPKHFHEAADRERRSEMRIEIQFENVAFTGDVKQAGEQLKSHQAWLEEKNISKVIFQPLANGKEISIVGDTLYVKSSARKQKVAIDWLKAWIDIQTTPVKQAAKRLTLLEAFEQSLQSLQKKVIDQHQNPIYPELPKTEEMLVVEKKALLDIEFQLSKEVWDLFSARDREKILEAAAWVQKPRPADVEGRIRMVSLEDPLILASGEKIEIIEIKGVAWKNEMGTQLPSQTKAHTGDGYRIIRPLVDDWGRSVDAVRSSIPEGGVLLTSAKNEFEILWRKYKLQLTRFLPIGYGIIRDKNFRGQPLGLLIRGVPAKNAKRIFEYFPTGSARPPELLKLIYNYGKLLRLSHESGFLTDQPHVGNIYADPNLNWFEIGDNETAFYMPSLTQSKALASVLHEIETALASIRRIFNLFEPQYADDLREFKVIFLNGYFSEEGLSPITPEELEQFLKVQNRAGTVGAALFKAGRALLPIVQNLSDSKNMPGILPENVVLISNADFSDNLNHFENRKGTLKGLLPLPVKVAFGTRDKIEKVSQKTSDLKRLLAGRTDLQFYKVSETISLADLGMPLLSGFLGVVLGWIFKKFLPKIDFFYILNSNHPKAIELQKKNQKREAWLEKQGLSFSFRSEARSINGTIGGSVLVLSRQELLKKVLILANVNPSGPEVKLTFEFKSDIRNFRITVEIQGVESGIIDLFLDGTERSLTIEHFVPFGGIDQNSTRWASEGRGVASTILNWLRWEAAKNDWSIYSSRTANIQLMSLFHKYFGENVVSDSENLMKDWESPDFARALQTHGLYGQEIVGAVQVFKRHENKQEEIGQAKFIKIKGYSDRYRVVQAIPQEGLAQNQIVRIANSGQIFKVSGKKEQSTSLYARMAQNKIAMEGHPQLATPDEKLLGRVQSDSKEKLAKLSKHIEDSILSDLSWIHSPIRYFAVFGLSRDVIATAQKDFVSKMGAKETSELKRFSKRIAQDLLKRDRGLKVEDVKFQFLMNPISKRNQKPLRRVIVSIGDLVHGSLAFTDPASKETDAARSEMRDDDPEWEIVPSPDGGELVVARNWAVPIAISPEGQEGYNDEQPVADDGIGEVVEEAETPLYQRVGVATEITSADVKQWAKTAAANQERAAQNDLEQQKKTAFAQRFNLQARLATLQVAPEQSVTISDDLFSLYQVWTYRAKEKNEKRLERKFDEELKGFFEYGVSVADKTVIAGAVEELKKINPEFNFTFYVHEGVASKLPLLPEGEIFHQLREVINKIREDNAANLYRRNIPQACETIFRVRKSLKALEPNLSEAERIVFGKVTEILYEKFKGMGSSDAFVKISFVQLIRDLEMTTPIMEVLGRSSEKGLGIALPLQLGSPSQGVLIVSGISTSDLTEGFEELFKKLKAANLNYEKTLLALGGHQEHVSVAILTDSNEFLAIPRAHFIPALKNLSPPIAAKQVVANFLKVERLIPSAAKRRTVRFSEINLIVIPNADAVAITTAMRSEIRVWPAKANEITEIIYVDDLENDREILEAFFDSFKERMKLPATIPLRLFRNGRELIAYLSGSPTSSPVILMDLSMPGTPDGDDIAWQINQPKPLDQRYAIAIATDTLPVAGTPKGLQFRDAQTQKIIAGALNAKPSTFEGFKALIELALAQSPTDVRSEWRKESKIYSEADWQKGRPWIDWANQHLKGNSTEAKDRNLFLPYLTSLFQHTRLSWDSPKIQRHYAQLINPEDIAAFMPFSGGQISFNRVVTHLRKLWIDSGYEKIHGPFDFWLTHASSTRNIQQFFKNAERLRLVTNPIEVLFYQGTISLHVRSYLHTSEDGIFPDNEVMVLNTPSYLAHFIEADERKELNDLVPENLRFKHRYKPVSERLKHLWMIASSIDPNVYFDSNKITLKPAFSKKEYWLPMMEGLGNLTYPSNPNRKIPTEKVATIFQEILDTHWEDYGLEKPWLAYVYELGENAYDDEKPGRLAWMLNDSNKSRPIFKMNFESDRFQNPFLIFMEPAESGSLRLIRDKDKAAVEAGYRQKISERVALLRSVGDPALRSELRILKTILGFFRKADSTSLWNEFQNEKSDFEEQLLQDLDQNLLALLEDHFARESEEIIRMAEEAQKAKAIIRNHEGQEITNLITQIQNGTIRKAAPVFFYSSTIHDELVQLVSALGQAFENRPQDLNLSVVFSNFEDRQHFESDLSPKRFSGVHFYWKNNQDLLRLHRQLARKDWNQSAGIFFAPQVFLETLELQLKARSVHSESLPEQAVMPLVPELIRFFSLNQGGFDQHNLSQNIPAWAAYLRVEKGRGIFILDSLLTFFTITQKTVAISA